MRYTRAVAVVVGAFMLVLPLSQLVSAGGTGHEDGEPMMVTAPPGTSPISCAVYFADNMVFAPQWRVDNLVRIEMMVIDMTGVHCPRCVENSTINLPISFFETVHPEFSEYLITQDLDGDGVEEVVGVDQQSFLLDGSDRIAYTSMVSASYIRATIVGVSGDALGYSKSFEAGWLSGEPYTQVISSELGREVNKHGNLIYGMLWDTADEENPAPAGGYSVNVELGKVVQDEASGEYFGDVGGDMPWYTVDYAIGHLYVGDGVLFEDEHPYVSLVSNEAIASDDNPDGDVSISYDGVELYVYADLGVGLGGVSQNAAWIELGPLIPRGPGGGNGGDGGDGAGGESGGNGVENGGNGQGNVGNRVYK